MFFPLVQLVVLGYAFGGKIKHLKVGVVDQDHGCRRSSCARCSGRSPPTRAPSRPWTTPIPRQALHGPAQRADQRRPQHPARFLPPRAGRGGAAGRADGGQHRQLRRWPRWEASSRNSSPPTTRTAARPRAAAAASRSRWSSSTLTFPTSSTSCRVRSCWPSSCRR